MKGGRIFYAQFSMFNFHLKKGKIKNVKREELST